MAVVFSLAQRQRKRRSNCGLSLRVMTMGKRDFSPITPGEILQEEFLLPMELSQYRVAKDIHVSARRINEIVKGKRAITADTALRLSTYFSNSASFWLGLQMDYDLDIAEDTLSEKIHNEVHQLAIN